MLFKYIIEFKSKKELDSMEKALNMYKDFLIKQIDDPDTSDYKKADYWLELSIVDGTIKNF